MRKNKGRTRDTRMPIQDERIVKQNGRLLTAKDVAALLGFRSERTVLRAFIDGRLKGLRLGYNTVRFTQRDVDKWIAKAKKE